MPLTSSIGRHHKSRAFRGLAGNWGGGESFSPLDISDLTGWWDPSDTSTITETGGSVSQLDDKSGNANHMTQAVGANQYRTGVETINGLNVLDKNGLTSRFFDLPDNIVTGSTNRTFFFVSNCLTTGTIWFKCGINSAGQVWTFLKDPGTHNLRIAVNSGTYTAAASDASGEKIVGVYLDGTDLSDIVLFEGNTEYPATGTRAINTDGTNTYVGRDDSTFNCPDELGEMIIYGKALSASERSQVLNYLSDKWAIGL